MRWEHVLIVAVIVSIALRAGMIIGLHVNDEFKIQVMDDRYRVQKFNGLWYKTLDLGGRPFRREMFDSLNTPLVVPDSILVNSFSTNVDDTILWYVSFTSCGYQAVKYEVVYPEPCRGTFSSADYALEWILNNYRHAKIKPAEWRDR